MVDVGDQGFGGVVGILMQAWSKCAQESMGNTEIETLKSLEHFSFKVGKEIVLR